jgi:glucokinase
MEATTKTAPVIGVDLGGTKLIGGVFDGDGTELARERIEVAGMDQDALVEALVGIVERLKDHSSEPVVAAGFGIPTTFDQRTGVAVQAANLPIANLPLRDILHERTGLEIFLDNDANVAALAEQRLGSGAGVTDHLLMITLGTGFGGGIVVDGHIVRGAIGAGAELGHVSIAYDGLPCISPNCPGIGCVEAYVGGNALARDARHLIEAEPNGELAAAVAAGLPAVGSTVYEIAKRGDESCIAVFTQMGKRLGVAMASFVNTFNPGVIAIGGGITPALEFMLPPAIEMVRTRALSPGNDYVQIVPASFGSDAGLVGAALMARDGLEARELQHA